ncbi:hypothetical protein K788_0000412 [Paraburkholderia caribensis MBA4]|uniref:Uncharacterized protein n=1 Tax=Paraburkholderia caribensis MBA4 TaxID=1323664 RepID=A0A0P0RIH1_9BURK|nr:hypothetical protein K788_0000412 [Paraburkholderia caribensis MBA4]
MDCAVIANISFIVKPTMASAIQPSCTCFVSGLTSNSGE